MTVRKSRDIAETASCASRRGMEKDCPQRTLSVHRFATLADDSGTGNEPKLSLSRLERTAIAQHEDLACRIHASTA